MDSLSFRIPAGVRNPWGVGLVESCFQIILWIRDASSHSE